MTVYIDVLIAVNIVVDYFLILLSAKFINIRPKSSKVIISAVIGGLFSIYIFFPHISVILDTVIKLINCIVMSVLAFGYKNPKFLLRCTSILFAVAFVYGGVMLALVNIVPINAVMVYNSVVYYDISPFMLIIFTGIFYIIACFLKFALKRNNPLAKNCIAEIRFNGTASKFEGIFDTGNSARDILGGCEVIIIDNKAAEKLIKGKPSDYPSSYRVIPISTVSGTKLLEAVRCEEANIYFDNKTITIEKPILAISGTKIDKEYSVLLNPELLTRAEA